MTNEYLNTLEQLQTATNPFVVISGIFMQYCEDTVAPEDIFERIIEFCLDNLVSVLPEELEEQVKSNLSELEGDKQEEYKAFVLASLPDVWPILLRKLTQSFYRLELPLEADYKEKSEMLTKILNYIHIFEDEL